MIKILIPLKLNEYDQIPQEEKGYLAVQSTSVGMHPHEEDVIIEDTAFYKLIHTAVDIVYTPSCTKFMKMVQAAGGKAINGLDMLLYQGLIAYELWNPDVKVDKDTIDTVRDMILAYLHGDVRKDNVIFTGFMGAGKTSAGQFYAKRYHMPFIDTDQEIEKEAGMAVSQIFAEKGEETYEISKEMDSMGICRTGFAGFCLCGDYSDSVDDCFELSGLERHHCCQICGY